MKIVFTGVCVANLVQAIYNDLQPETASCIGRLIQTPNPLPDIAEYHYEPKGADKAAERYADNSLDFVWIGDTDDNILIFERSAWMPKLKTGGRLIVQHIYRAGEPVEIQPDDNSFPDNFYIVKA